MYFVKVLLTPFLFILLCSCSAPGGVQDSFWISVRKSQQQTEKQNCNNNDNNNYYYYYIVLLCKRKRKKNTETE